MKGDFTRLTFRPQKHYSSVRMQQGRLQLDADWNEQVDIQTHLTNSQSIDMIGFESGVPSAETVSGTLNRDGFSISITPDGQDLTIHPGHLYARGTLCELESGTFLTAKTVNAADPKTIEADTLTLDERSLQVGQWLEAFADDSGNPIAPPQRVQITEIQAAQRQLTLSSALKPPVRLRRLVTYFQQPDFVAAEKLDELDAGVYAVFLDVWERHITGVEDPAIREVALSIPDTTTRTQTVWQLKLKRFDQLPGVGNQTLPELDDPNWKALIEQHWTPYLQAQRERVIQARMNACAKSCPIVGNGTGNGTNNGTASVQNRRLDNQLYRVEIHTPGKLGVATFKWSRDNGSVVSAIDTGKGIQGGVIPIQKSGLEAWTSAQPGQWIEITSTNQDLQGKPGTLAPFQQATDTRILFNAAQIVGDFDLANATTVRRWDHATQTASIPTSSEWTPLENGIKVRFEPLFEDDTIYETGDYWLIPARAIDNDIQWTDNGAQPQPQPLAQSPQGIHHEYALLALVKVEQTPSEQTPSEQTPSEQPPSAEVLRDTAAAQTAKISFAALRDCRVVFPPLMRCVDKDQGIFTGTLEVQSDFYVTGKGRAGIGVKPPAARLHVQATSPTPGGKISITGTEVKQIDNLVKEQIRIGDILLVNNQTVTVTSTSPLTIAPPIDVSNQDFVYQSAIARFDDSTQTPQLMMTATGEVGIGTFTPTQKLEVNGTVKAISFLGSGAQLDGVVKTTGANTITGSLTVTQDMEVNGQLRLRDNSLSGSKLIDGSITEDKLGDDVVANLKLKDGSVTTSKLANNAVTSSKISDSAVTNSKINNGAVTSSKISDGAITSSKINSGAVGTVELADGAVTLNKLAPAVRPAWQDGDNNSLFYNKGNVGIGTNDPKSLLSIAGNLAIGNNTADQQAAPINGLLVRGHTGIGVFDSALTAKLEVQGAKKKTDADANTTAALNVTDQSRESLFFVRNNGNVGINTNQPRSTLHVVGAVTIGDRNTDAPNNVSLFVKGKLESKTISGEEFTQISSRTLKQNIAELSSQEVTQLLAALTPVKFNYTSDQPEILHAGFIAEDVPDLVASADHQAVRLGDIVAILTKAVKDQRQAINSLTRIAKNQQQTIAALTEQIQRLQG
ncbi:DUF6519 domain-containing protein [Leptolyngbya ohadii]|uniref:DUF6519 domain-containing protein n=1 Tax=Leptolyngbya ohadii TaxID=1962290 RepID=UPI000B5A0F1C|nr:DUF6519 domain-containing protein [Leptolyngbya ohadii]